MADDTNVGSSQTQPSPGMPEDGGPENAEKASGKRNRGCLSEDQVLAYLEGRTSSRARDAIHLHLDACHDCWLLVQSLLGYAEASAEEEIAPYRVTTFSVGTVIADRYRVERFIGKGGMGEVYLAHDGLMNRRVALKTPLCTTSDDPSALRKFFDEARNADRITHANICRIYALQEHRDPAGLRPAVPFFTMEFIEGETLAARLSRGPMPLVAARIIARQLLEGLRAAHQKRVLHLDFKSDNVMLRHGTQAIDAVIMDFGLSRQRDAILRTSQYQRGIGTLPYMALEQLEGRRNLAPTVDVYAFGVVLYEMLTGQLPFREASIGAMLIKQMRERPALPSSLRPELSAEVDAFVMKCLNRVSSRRHEDAGAALLAFQQLHRWTGRSNAWRQTSWRWAEATLAVSLSFLLTSDDAVRARVAGPEPIAASLPAPMDDPPSDADARIRLKLRDPSGEATQQSDASKPSAPGSAGFVAEAEAAAAVPKPVVPRKSRSNGTSAPVTRSSGDHAAQPEDPPSEPLPQRSLKALPRGPIPLTRLLGALRKQQTRLEAPAETASESAMVAETVEIPADVEGQVAPGASVKDE